MGQVITYLIILRVKVARDGKGKENSAPSLSVCSFSFGRAPYGGCRPPQRLAWTSLCSQFPLRPRRSAALPRTLLFLQQLNRETLFPMVDKLRTVWLSRGLRLPSEAGFCG